MENEVPESEDLKKSLSSSDSQMDPSHIPPP